MRLPDGIAGWSVSRPDNRCESIIPVAWRNGMQRDALPRIAHRLRRSSWLSPSGIPSLQGQACFVPRGDHSGTHIAELNLWKATNIDIEKDTGPWYKSIGQGMGAALGFANASNCYVLSDRGTWIHYKNRGELQILVEGDRRMFNQYGVMLVNPAKHPAVKRELGQQFIDWLISADGQNAIADYKINGEQLFYPDANDPNA